MTGQPLTILQLTHQGGPAGSTQSIFNLSQYLARRGHRVLVGCRGDVLLARLARAAGLPVVPLAFMPRAALMSALTAVLGRERVDVVNAHATLPRRARTWPRWRGRAAGGRDRLAAQGSARRAPGAPERRARGRRGVRRGRAGRPPACPSAVGASPPPRGVRASHRSPPRLLSPGGRGRLAVPDGGTVAGLARSDGARVAGRGVGSWRQPGSRALRRDGAPGLAARSGGVGGSA